MSQHASDSRSDDKKALPSVVSDLRKLGLGANWPASFEPTWGDLLSLRGPPDRSYVCAAVNDRTLESLRHAPNLVCLDLSSSNVTDDGMTTLSFVPVLEELDVTNTHVGDLGVCRLLQHRRLRWFTAMDAHVTILGERLLRASIPGCNASIGRQLTPGRVVDVQGDFVIVRHERCGEFWAELKGGDREKFADLLRNPIGRSVSIQKGLAGESDRLFTVKD
jgi:hypothetical protein